MARSQYNPPPRARHLEAPMVLREDNLIDKVTDDRSPHYEPFGWHHWPEHPWLSYQFRRGLGEREAPVPARAASARRWARYSARARLTLRVLRPFTTRREWLAMSYLEGRARFDQ